MHSCIRTGPCPPFPPFLLPFRAFASGSVCVIVHHRKRSLARSRARPPRGFQDPSDCPYFTAAASSSPLFHPLSLSLSRSPFLISSPLLQTSSPPPPPTPPSLPNQIMISPFPSPPILPSFSASPPTKGSRSFVVRRFVCWRACV